MKFYQYTYLFLLQLIIGWFSFFLPFGRDQAEYATLGWLFLEGATIYIDYFSVKPPGSHLVHALAIALFGHDMQSIRILDFILIYITSSLLFFLSSNRIGHLRAYFVSILFYLAYYQFDYWSQAQTESFQLLPLLLAIFCLRHLTSLRVFFAGICLGAASLFKYPILFGAPLFSLYLTSYAKERRFQRFLLFSLGVVLPYFIFFLNLLVHEGLYDFFSMTAGYYSRYVTISGFPIPRVQPLLFRCAIIFFPLLGVILCLLRKDVSTLEKRQDLLFAIFALSGLAQLFLQRKFNDYHHMILLVPFAYFTILLWSNLSKAIVPKLRLRLIHSGYFLFFLIVFLAPHLVFLPYKISAISEVVSGEIDLKQHYEKSLFSHYDTGGDYSIRAVAEVSEYLRTHIKPESRIFIWGFESGIYFLTRRKPASRFIYNFLLYPHYRDTNFRSFFLRDFASFHPEVLIIVKNDRIPWVTNTVDDSQQIFVDYDEFYALAHKDYKESITIEDFQIYCRKDLFCPSHLQ